MSLVDWMYHTELEMVIPSRKFNRAAGRPFVFSDGNIGLFTVETTYTKLFTQIQALHDP